MTGVTEARFERKAGLQWRRILIAALLLEVILFAVLVPLGLAFGMPGAGNGTDYTVFFIAVPVGCLLFGYLSGRWMGKRLASRRVLHGVLLGVSAFAIYLAVCSIPPNSIAMVIAGYGATRFWLFNGLRLIGCVAGATASPT